MAVWEHRFTREIWVPCNIHGGINSRHSHHSILYETHILQGILFYYIVVFCRSRTSVRLTAGSCSWICKDWSPPKTGWLTFPKYPYHSCRITWSFKSSWNNLAPNHSKMYCCSDSQVMSVFQRPMLPWSVNKNEPRLPREDVHVV